jgi:hypothetical protein
VNVTRQTLATLDLLGRLYARDAALWSLIEALDPRAELSISALADEIARRLRRFERTAWPRIRSGFRVPQNDIERGLVALIEADTPRSVRRVYDLLVDLLGD